MLRHDKMRPSLLLPALLVVGLCTVVPGCPAPEPVAPKKTAEKPLSDEDAHDAMEKAAEAKNIDDLIGVYNKYRKLPSGKEALRRAARLMMIEVKALAEKCEESAARGSLSRLAPFTTEDAEINEAYDDMAKQISTEHGRCQLVKLDAAIKKAEKDGDWPVVFEQIRKGTDIEGATLKQRRLAAIVKWKTWLDDTIRPLCAKKSATLDDTTADRLADAVDENKMPPELSEDLAKWGPIGRTAKLIFHDMKDGEIFDPPRAITIFTSATSRTLATPKVTDGPTLAVGAKLSALGRGALDGKVLYVVGGESKDVVLRLGTAKLLVQEEDTKPKKK